MRLIKFHIGCGKRCWPGWFNVDGGDYEHVYGKDITLTYQPDNFIDLIYSSHMIAYLTRAEFVSILKSWYKKIKPGGTLRLATPDALSLMKLYTTGVITLPKILGPLYGEMEMAGAKIYHKSTYDATTLYYILKDAGFENIREYDHRKTEHPNTGDFSDPFDDCSAAYINGTLISLNMEASKP